MYRRTQAVSPHLEERPDSVTPERSNRHVHGTVLKEKRSRLFSLRQKEESDKFLVESGKCITDLLHLFTGMSGADTATYQ